MLTRAFPVGEKIMTDIKNDFALIKMEDFFKENAAGFHIAGEKYGRRAMWRRTVSKSQVL